MRIPFIAASSMQNTSFLGCRNISFTLEFQPRHPSSLVAYRRFHENYSVALLNFRNEPITHSSMYSDNCFIISPCPVLPTAMSAHFSVDWESFRCYSGSSIRRRKVTSHRPWQRCAICPIPNISLYQVL